MHDLEADRAQMQDKIKAKVATKKANKAALVRKQAEAQRSRNALCVLEKTWQARRNAVYQRELLVEMHQVIVVCVSPICTVAGSERTAPDPVAER